MLHYTIRIETERDYRAVEALTREAFWNVFRPGCTEHYVLHRYRSRPDFIPELSLILEVDGQLTGHVMFAASTLQTTQGTSLPILTFGPISIAPSRQRQGWGKILLDEALRRATLLGWGAVAITGNIDFYRHCGFTLASSQGVRYADAAPGDAVVPYFLFRRLQPDALDGAGGIYRDPDGYFVADREPEAFEAYDATFPPKVKEHRPGQIF